MEEDIGTGGGSGTTQAVSENELELAKAAKESVRQPPLRELPVEPQQAARCSEERSSRGAQPRRCAVPALQYDHDGRVQKKPAGSQCSGMYKKKGGHL